MNRAMLIVGDCMSLLPGDPVPKRGTAVRGRALYDGGVHIGRTFCTRARAAFEYVIEPDGDSLRILYTREATS